MKGVNRSVCLVNENTQWPEASLIPQRPLVIKRISIFLYLILKGFLHTGSVFQVVVFTGLSVCTEQEIYVTRLFTCTALGY